MPTRYGWTISVPQNSHGVTLRNIAAPNAFQLIYVNADGILIDGIQGYPLSVGIRMDRVADVPRINNVHFNPNVYPSLGDSLKVWVEENGICCMMGWVEEFMVTNFFGFGYLRGFWFMENTQSFGSYGSIVNFGFDKFQEGFLVEHRGISGRQGLSIANGRVIPFGGAVGARTGIKFADTALVGSEARFNPLVNLSNVGFFSSHQRSIWIGADSGARVTMVGGQSADYAGEAVLVESDDARVRLYGVRTANGTGVRIRDVSAGSDALDDSPIAD